MIKINGKNLYAEHTLIDKDRPTIVFLHDSLGCVHLWRDFPQKVGSATNCNVLVYDRFGYGRSEPMTSYERPNNYLDLEAEILNEILEKFEIENAILFGHSDGGSISLIAASNFPQRIKAVIVEAAHIFVEEITLNGIYEMEEVYKNTDLPQRLKKYHGDRTEMIFLAWTKTWTRSAYRTWNIEYLLPGISCPLLFIQGEDDEYGSILQVDRTIEQVSGQAEKFILPKVGHTPHKEAPDPVRDKTVAFIESLNFT